MLARAGHTAILAARDAAALEELARAIAAEGGNAEVLPLDVTDPAAVARAVTQLTAAGGCDILVNNAALCRQTDFLLHPLDAQRAELEVNYWGPVRLTRALLPGFIARGYGWVVNVSSILGSVASPTTVNYCASKAALEAFSEALHAEVSPFGIGVSVFVAPHTDTDSGRKVVFEGVHSLPPSYTAQQLVRAIDRAPRRHAGSPVYSALLWMARLAPGTMRARIAASARPQLVLRTGADALEALSRTH